MLLHRYIYKYLKLSKWANELINAGLRQKEKTSAGVLWTYLSVKESKGNALKVRKCATISQN